MKIRILSTALLLCLFSVFTFAQGSKMNSDVFFDKLADTEGVEVVVITKTLFQLMPSGTTDVGGINIGDLTKKLDHLGIYRTENAKALELIRKIKKEAEKDKAFEVLMTVKEDDEESVFLIERGAGDTIKSFLMFVIDGEDATVIRLLGNFDTNDMKHITESIGM